MIDREPVDIMGVTAFPNPNKLLFPILRGGKGKTPER